MSAEATPTFDLRERARRVFASREVALLALTVFFVVLFSILYPVSFRSWANFNAILRNLAFEGMLAIGMMMLMVGGVFDLSVGACASMAGVVTGWLLKSWGWPVPLAILAGLAVGGLAGALNGMIVAKFRVNALITTLGTMGIFQGVALLIAGPGITFLPESFSWLGQAERWGVQGPVWLMFLLALVAHYLMAHTRFFRQYYYIGSNPKAAHLSGIHVVRLRIVAFTVMGLIAGLAGIAYASRIATASATVGTGAELQAIAAVILGGASLSGGRGTIWGALIGVFFMALVKNILLIMGISPEWQGIALGVVLVAAVAIDAMLNQDRQD